MSLVIDDLGGTAVATAGTGATKEMTLTPFLSGTSVVAVISSQTLVGSTALIIQGSIESTFAAPIVKLTTAEIADTTIIREITTEKFMRYVVTGYTSGTVDFMLIAGI